MKKNNKISDKTILQFQKGKEKAFTQIYNVYKDKIYFMAINFFKDEQIAEDIVQETFMKVIQDIKTLKSPEAFHIWILRIAYRTCIDQTRKKMYAMQEELDEEVEDQQTPTVIRQMKSQEISETVLKIIESMAPSLRYVCILRFYEGLSVKETAEVLGITENAVKVRTNRAKSYLKEELEKKNMTPKVYMSAIQPEGMLLLFASLQAQNTLSTSVQSAILAHVVETSTLSSGIGLLPIAATVIAVVTTSASVYYLQQQTKSKPNETVVTQNVSTINQITNITYNQDYTNQAITVDLETIHQDYDYITINDIKTDMIVENGTYKISLIQDGEVVDSKDITINNIDTKSPRQIGVKEDTDYYTIQFQDDLSMIDENKIELYVDDIKSLDFYFDEKTQGISLPVDIKKKYRLLVPDKAGNYTYSNSRVIHE